MKKRITAILALLLFCSTALPGQEGDRMVSAGGISFLLADDYIISARQTFPGGEACLIRLKDAPSRDNRLILRIHKDALQGINGLTSEELGDMLSRAVDTQAGVLADERRSGYKRAGKYEIHYEDNADGTYFPHCYSFLNLRDPKTKRLVYTYTQATLVSGNLISGCAVATDEGELAALMDIYSAVITGSFL